MTDKYRRSPCPECTSSDAYTIYPDGHGHCYSCGYRTRKGTHDTYGLDTSTTKFEDESELSLDGTIEKVFKRGISFDTALKYTVPTLDGVRSYPYFDISNGKELIAVKKKKEETKDFWCEGKLGKAGLFGSQLFPPDPEGTIVITEGEDDALAAYDMLKVPCVSVKSGAQSAKREIVENYDYLCGFKHIVLCFDNDKPGREATAECVKVLPLNKLKVMDFGEGSKFKDACDFGLLKDNRHLFIKLFSGAKAPSPKGIIEGSDAWLEAINKPVKESVAHYPWQSVDLATHGLRYGEVVMITAETGVGKSYVLNEVLWSVLNETDEMIGCIGQEEDESDMGKRLMSLHFNRPTHFEAVRSDISDEDWMNAQQLLVPKLERMIGHYEVADLDVDAIINMIVYMVEGKGCKFIFYDHMSMATAQHKQDDERKALDVLSTRLKALAKKLDFSVVVVSHINREGTVKGSSNPEKVADVWLSLERDKMQEDPDERNITQMELRKNRFVGTTGPCGRLFFDTNTYRLEEYVG